MIAKDSEVLRKIPRVIREKAMRDVLSKMKEAHTLRGITELVDFLDNLPSGRWLKSHYRDFVDYETQNPLPYIVTVITNALELEGYIKWTGCILNLESNAKGFLPGHHEVWVVRCQLAQDLKEGRIKPGFNFVTEQEAPKDATVEEPVSNTADTDIIIG